MDSLTAKLAQNPVFSTLRERDLDQLAQMAIRRDYEKDTWIVDEGEVWPYLLWVERGSITASKKSLDGRTLIAAVIGSGEIFWGMAFFLEDEPMPAALKAQIPSRVQLWPRDRLLPLLLRNGQSSWALACQLVGRMGQASEIVQELAFQPVTGRLARLLLERYEAGNENPVPRDLTLDEMAAHIGSTREMVCRALYRFADQGLIQITRTEFLFKDQDGLETLAQRSRKG
jgi:CRP/FNR family cyclic AMP-dependent transcriptional regulator